MLKTTPADAAAALKEALATLPAGLEAHSDFFVQWRTRTIELLERLFPDDPGPPKQFKEIEFSPRLLTRNDERDEQLKLDACLAGCDAARSLLNGLAHGLIAPSLPPIQQEIRREAQTPAVVVDASPLPESAEIITGGTMDSRELCAPVRTSLARVLGAWDQGDRDMALVLSAQLLADLTLLTRDDRFRGTFDKVVSKTFDNGTAEAVKSSAPLCIWSLVAAMNEVMKN